MRAAIYLGWLLLFGSASMLAAQVQTIDFEDAAGPSVFDSIQPPLQVLSATLTGGEVLTNTTFLPADASSVYGTSFFCNGCLPEIQIDFSQRVSDLSFLLLNGDTFVVTYTIEDDQGNTQEVTLDANLDGGAGTVSVPD